jgi:hypothetical protein
MGDREFIWASLTNPFISSRTFVRNDEHISARGAEQHLEIQNPTKILMALLGSKPGRTVQADQLQTCGGRLIPVAPLSRTLKASIL